MITRDEIDKFSAEQDVNSVDVERDYVFSWLLAGIFNESRYASTLTLKGGNALRKGYFPATRFSGDLDFSSPSQLDPDGLLEELNRTCKLVQARTEVVFDTDKNRLASVAQIRRDKTEYKYKLYFHDFYGGRGDIVVSVRVGATEFDKLYLPVQTRRLIHPYSDAGQCVADIRVVKLEEALADKLKCLLQRRSSYDLYDLLHATLISRDIEVDRLEMMRTFFRKTIFSPSPQAAKNLLLGVPFEAMKRFWESKISCPSSSRFPFADAVESFRTLVNELFSNFAPGRGATPLFFPAEYRNLIMEAGQSQKLLELHYHGVIRLVEPYALTFKRRQDGLGQEYFYAYDRSGGRRSGPGIKTFLNPDIQSLRITDQKFEPRYEIEVAKAGEVHSTTSFTGRRTSSYRLRTPSRPIRSAFTIQCSYCGRRFDRQNRRSTTIRPHSDQSGNRCFGRRGYFI